MTHTHGTTLCGKSYRDPCFTPRGGVVGRSEGATVDGGPLSLYFVRITSPTPLSRSPPRVSVGVFPETYVV